MHHITRPHRMSRNKRWRVKKQTNWDRVAAGRDLAILRARHGSRQERRTARFAELKAEEKKRKKANQQ